MPNWTKAQEQAINDRGGTLLVSASAGSGKTAVLVARALRMMTGPDPIDADRLLILTFTNPAAAQMKSRLSLELDSLILQSPDCIPLRRQQMLLQKANISTVNAFCLGLIRDNAAALGIPPDFSVADDAIISALKQQTIEEVTEASCADPDFRAFSDLFGHARSDADAEEAILKVYDELRALPFFDRSLQQLEAMYTQPKAPSDSVWWRYLTDEALRICTDGFSICGEADRLIASDPALKPYQSCFESERKKFAVIREAMEGGRWDEAYAVVSSYAKSRLPSRKKKSAAGQTETEEKQAAAQTILTGLRDRSSELFGRNMLAGVVGFTEDTFSQDIQRSAPLVRAFVRAVKLFSDRFFEAKKQEKAFEFSDFEHLALRLLCGEDGNKTKLGREVSEQFDAVMVDEYQDANALQDTLYELLANEDQSNLFMVGDIKQSIYGFRMAMPEIFIGKRDRFSRYDGKRYPANLVLEHNFRSDPGVIRGINEIFSVLMTRRVGGVDYRRGEQLIPGAVASAGNMGPAVSGRAEADSHALQLDPVEIMMIETSADPAGGEADTAAEKILQMVRGGFYVRDLHAESPFAKRPCRWGDFCILLRTGENADLYAAALLRRGIPAFCDRESSILSEPELQPLIAMLRILDNPAQDVPLAVVLTSPMYGFTSGDLAAIRSGQREGSLYGAVISSTLPRAVHFSEELRLLRSMAASMPVNEICETVLEKTGYRLKLMVAQDSFAGSRAQSSSVGRFLQMAAEYASSGRSGLSGFLRYLDHAGAASLRRKDGSVLPPEDHVCILTIHRSKGLEFPIVFLCDTERKFNYSDLQRSSVFSRILGVGFQLKTADGRRFRSVPVKAIIHAEKQQRVSEEMRLLYVALTRARDHLCITVAGERITKSMSKLAEKAGCGRLLLESSAEAADRAGTWIGLACFFCPEGRRFAVDAGSDPAASVRLAGGAIRCSVVAAGAAKAAGELPIREHVRSAEADPQLTAALIRSFSWKYPREDLLRIPIKTTVTELVRREDSPAGQPLKRPAFMTEGGLTAAEKGTALHRILQYLDFEKAAESLEAELSDLVSRDFIAPAEADAADRDALKTFLSSGLMGRMLEADEMLREYPFFCWISAGEIDGGLREPLTRERVLVQGVCDCVFRRGNHWEIVDYKTDRGKTGPQLADYYRPQLQMYRMALARRFDDPVTDCSLYSFALGKEIRVIGPA